MRIGDSGMGQVSIDAGGAVSGTVGSIGRSSGSGGTVTVAGAGSTWTNSNRVRVGVSGSGELFIEDGGSVLSTHGIIGKFTGSSGAAIVTGAGSSWTMTGRLAIGGSHFGTNGGAGTLTIESGAMVDVALDTVLWPDGLLRLQGGALTTSEFDFQGGIFQWTSGRLEVGGLFDNDLTNPSGGTLAPGPATAGMTITGNYTQHAAAAMEIEIGGIVPGQFDTVTVAGNAVLNGTLDISLINSFEPLAGNSFTILQTQFGNVGGQFASVLAPVIDGMTFDVVYDAQSVVLQVIQAALLPGDANGDGRVDGEDFLIWQANFGMQSGAAWGDGDFNGDGRVDGEDFLIWQAHFGSVAAAAAFTPEPAALSMLLLAGAALAARRRA